ncbi:MULTISPECIES: response regulator transcription factor [unclassified Pseudomonas]|uniref:response regulator transcription factor n=1 Tax=unclassified Pseudomonas TaxID=196821 RepID=UPI001199627D|nr:MULTISPECIES: response regulator transcription factor [unclassified Pseudomonas]TWC06660.1 LuxR family two component transcriptional regulator [Pseudomonas sp. SJZ075]TWC26642.1 LuxR family two component transcriptional regulator [Pseudomonas sp. SJZ078]TWC44049.1 LuxR family two component transcriptional regulator [Pseudomonas sp. SJZ080]TWC45352.1 LuxR family two component transcriptional regulator [Pseudomonas sp. SJZ124]TWC80432.1 LuxR family two component transcriptional regulator [Pse
MPTALIVDDHPFVRASVKMILVNEGFEEVIEADNGSDALHIARTLEPDLLVLDIGIPQVDGMEVIERIRLLGLSIKILVLTAQPAEYVVARCMNAGVAGFVSKADDLSNLSKALKVLMSGYTYFPDVALLSVRRRDNQSGEAEQISSLSDRELMVFRQLALGLSNKQIGDAMLLSNKTISTYKTRLIEKLKVSSVVELADLAKRHGMV